MKTLSFIIPAYNCAGFLERCITSMLVPRLLSKLEILVVDDGSTDDTASVAQRFCALYPDTVKLIRQENRGHGGALNTGCAAATGKYLKVIDADDRVITENLAAFLDSLDRCGSDVVLTHHHTLHAVTGEVRSWKSYPEAFGRSYTMEEIMANPGNFDRSLTFHGITYRRDFYQSQGYRLSEHVFYEDHEYATFPCCHAGSITPLDLFVYEYRIGDANQSVAQANQLRRMGHTETVLRNMMAACETLPESAGRQYAAMKIRVLLLSYLTTALLVQPDRAAGRRQAQAAMAHCRSHAPESYAMTRKKYPVLLLLNRLHVSKAVWDKCLDSPLYRRLLGKHDFQ